MFFKRLVLLFFIFTSIALSASNAERPNFANTFSMKGLSQGSQSTREHCLARSQTVWVQTHEGGECIKYFAAGLNSINPIAIIHFPGDVADISVLSRSIKNVDPDYLQLDEKSMTLMATVNAFRSGVPFIFIGRPGTFGASGYHGMRLTEMNPRILHAALNQIKVKHNILRVTLSGQSGGGAVVSALMNWRNDVQCAVLGSSAGARFEKIVLANPEIDMSDFRSKVYDPSVHIPMMPKDEYRQIYFLSDKTDKIVQQSIQRSYFEKIKKAGHQATFHEFDAHDEANHDLSGYSLNVATACSTGVSPEALGGFLETREVKSIYDIGEELQILMRYLAQQASPG